MTHFGELRVTKIAAIVFPHPVCYKIAEKIGVNREKISSLHGSAARKWAKSTKSSIDR